MIDFGVGGLRGWGWGGVVGMMVVVDMVMLVLLLRVEYLLLFFEILDIVDRILLLITNGAFSLTVVAIIHLAIHIITITF